MKLVILKKGVHDDQGSVSQEIENHISKICSAVVLLKAEKPGEKNIIADTGSPGYADEILASLKKEGLKPEDIEFVLITHTHMDHVFNTYLFRNASIVRCRVVDYPNHTLTMFKSSDSVKIPGVAILPTPGHAENHTSYVVKSGGKTYVIAGDAIREERIKTGTFGVPPNQEYIDSARKIAEIADVIIPGHGRIIQGKDLDELRKAVYRMKVK